MAGISDALGERFDKLDMPFHRYGAAFFDYRFVAHNPPVNVLGRVFQFSSDKLYVDPDPLRMVFFMVVDADAAIKDKPLDLHPLPSITDTAIFMVYGRQRLFRCRRNGHSRHGAIF